VFSVDGGRFLDCSANFTALIHGHVHPSITSAVHAQLARGTAFSLATESEIDLAETLCARAPTFERVRFMNSGTEAVMWAVKAARAYTGRPKIAKIEGAYHDGYDYAEISNNPAPDNWGPNYGRVT
jgi:glutamate-1-semialdehyde 2,1-aminomutase